MTMVAWYPLNGDILDYSGNNNVATNSGATTNTNGKIGSCYSFSGSSTYISIPNNIQNTSIYSIAFWMKANSPVAWTDVLTFNTGEATNAYRIEYDGVGGYRSYGTGPNPSGPILFSHDGSSWAHVAIVCDGITIKCYYNGAVSYSASITANKTPSTATILLGARVLAGNCWAGYLNDVRIYNTALSIKEVYEISKAKILHYKFDDFQEPTTNIVHYQNPRIDSSYTPYVATTSGTWQAKHSDAIKVYNNDGVEITGYVNNGVTDWTNTYHATWILDTELNKPVVIMRDLDGYWKAKSFSMATSMTGLGLIAGSEYTVSWLQWTTDIAKSANTGVYGKNTSAMDGFHDGQSNAQPSSFNTQPNTWQRVYATFTVNAIRDMSSTISLYMYGYTGPRGTLKISDIQFETKNHATDFTAKIRTATVRDCSGYGVDAPLNNNSPKWTSTSMIGSGAYNFTSANSQYICIPNSQCKVTGQITASLWAYRTNWNEATSERIISCTEGGGWSLGFNDVVNNLSSVMYCNGAYTNVPVLLSTISAGWHHIAFTFDGRYQKLYLDGVLKGTVDKGATYPLGYNATNSIFIGAEAGSNVAVPAGQYWNGNIDDVRIYATALSDSDIQSLYNTRASLDNYGNMYVNQLKYKFPKSAYDIKLKYPNAPSGVYTIQPDPNSEPFEAYCDMTTDGGGWTLLVCSTTSTGWTTTNVLNRNSTTPSITSDYSILNKADIIKSNIAGNLQYRFDATAFGRYGGSFSAPYNYTFTKTDNSQTSVSLITQYDSWTYNDAGIEQRMPWLGTASGLLTTSTLNSGNWWGTIVSNASFNPAPWISTGPTDPGKIWYWVR